MSPTDSVRNAVIDGSQCLEAVWSERDESATCHVASLFLVIDLQEQESHSESQKTFTRQSTLLISLFGVDVYRARAVAGSTCVNAPNKGSHNKLIP